MPWLTKIFTWFINALAPHVAEALLRQPTYWGDRDRVHLGRDVHVVNTLFNTASGDITVGDESFFGHNVCLLTGTHDVLQTGITRQRAVPPAGRDIVIGKGVWIASNATVLGPCAIGDHAVVGPGSLVKGDIPAGWFYAGVPARPVRKIALFGADQSQAAGKVLRPQ